MKNFSKTMVISALLTGAPTLCPAFDYMDYIGEHEACMNKFSGEKAVQCQRDARTRLECARTSDEEGCLVRAGGDLLQQKKLEDSRKQQEALSNQLRNQAAREQEAREAAEWRALTDKRKSFGAGKWNVSEGEPDPIDDSRVVVALLNADSGTSSLGNEKIQMVIRCRSNKTVMYINWGDYVTDSTIVTHRFDKKKPVSQTWQSSTDKTVSFYYGSGVAIAKILMVTDRFVARTTPYNENPVTAIFDTRGLSKAIAPLREACNW